MMHHYSPPARLAKACLRFFACILAGLSWALPSQAQTQTLEFNANNFPDTVVANWLRNYVRQNHPGAFTTAGSKTYLNTTKLNGVLQALATDPSVNNRVTDLRCMRWFPSQDCTTQSTSTGKAPHSVNLGMFDNLKYIDLSGWDVWQIFMPTSHTPKSLQYLRLKNCKRLRKLEFSFIGPTDIFDLQGCDSLNEVYITNTILDVAPSATQPPYCDAPRFRHLDLSSSGMFSTCAYGKESPRNVLFGEFPQLATLDMPRTWRPGGQPVETFRLNNSMVSSLETYDFLEKTDNVDVAGNRLENLSILAPGRQAGWDLAGNNFSHLEVRPSGGTGTVVPGVFASSYHPGTAPNVDVSSWLQYGTVTSPLDCTLNAAANDLAFNTSSPTASYIYTSQLGGVAIGVTVLREMHPLTVTLTSEYTTGPAGDIVRRPTPAVYNFTPDPNRPNVYVSPVIDELAGPYRIEASTWARGATQPSPESTTYVLAGSPRDATYSDVAETQACVFDRRYNGCLPADWWPVVITKERPLGDSYTLLAETYFDTEYSTVPPHIGALRSTLLSGSLFPASRANLQLTTLDTWTGTGSPLRQAKLRVEYVAGNPAGKMWVQTNDSGADDPFADAVGENDPPTLWFDLSGRQLRGEPSAPGIYIRRQGRRAEKIKI